MWYFGRTYVLYKVGCTDKTFLDAVCVCVARQPFCTNRWFGM
jgi:hypothetical protein